MTFCVLMFGTVLLALRCSYFCGHLSLCSGGYLFKPGDAKFKYWIREEIFLLALDSKYSLAIVGRNHFENDYKLSADKGYHQLDIFMNQEKLMEQIWKCLNIHIIGSHAFGDQVHSDKFPIFDSKKSGIWFQQFRSCVGSIEGVVMSIANQKHSSQQTIRRSFQIFARIFSAELTTEMFNQITSLKALGH